LLFALFYTEWKAADIEKKPIVVDLVLKSRFFRVAMSLCGVGLILFVIWIVSPLQENPGLWPDSLLYTWAAVCRMLFVIGVAIFVFPSLFGKNRFFVSMLNNSFFLVLARISYCGYLLQLVVITVASAAWKGSFLVSDLTLFYDWLATMVICVVASIVLILLVELPCANLELILLSKQKVASKEPSSILSEIVTDSRDHKSSN